MQLRRPTESDRVEMARFAAQLQARPEHHVAYLGTEADAIADEMIEDVDDWTEAAVVAEKSGRLVGWTMGSVDRDLGRVWWFGPFVHRDDPADWKSLADALDAEAHALLAGRVTEEEYAFDSRHLAGIGWAIEGGATEGTGSAVLVLDDPIGRPTTSYRPVRADDLDAVGSLHDSLFPGTHTTGEVLVRGHGGDRLRLVIERDGGLLGYIAVERQHDGTGYIDYLGVAPAHRRQGIGAELIRAGVTALRDLGCGRVSLTVRADNHDARSLYTGLGFVEERIIVPLRIGFSLG